MKYILILKMETGRRMKNGPCQLQVLQGSNTLYGESHTENFLETVDCDSKYIYEQPMIFL